MQRVTTNRRAGRPPLDHNDPSVGVHVKVPGRQFDLLYERAQKARVSMAEIVRRDLRRAEQDRNT